MNATYHSSVTHRDSLENKIIGFFDRNPSEELTINDATVKFGARYDTTADVLAVLHSRGLLLRVRDTDGLVYRASAVIRVECEGG